MKSNQRLFGMHKQQGAALVISLLILIIITIVGVSAMQSTVVEEKMAINANERNRAFQAAETALRHAEENFIMGLLNTSNFNGANGLYGQSDNEPNLFSTTWTDTNSRAYSGSIGYVNTQPRFMVRLMDTIAGSDVNNMLNIRGYRRQNIASAITTVFRVTARGTGSTDQSQVIVRSHYGRTGL